MGYSWVFLGTAELPPGAHDAWLDGPADPALSRAQLDGPTLRALGLDESALAPTVRELFDELQSEDVARIDVDGPITLHLLADKSGDAWLTWRANLAAAFVALAAHGGRGQLLVVGFDDGPDDGFRLDVGTGQGAQLRRLVASEVADVRRSDGYQEVAALADAFYAPLLADPTAAEPIAPARGSYLDSAMRTVAERALFDARDGLRRLERRMLWTLFAEGGHAQPVAPEALAARVAEAHPGTDPAVVLAALAGLAKRRGSTISLVAIDEAGRYRLTPLAADALAEPADLHRITERDAPEPRALPLAIPWLLAAGGQAIALGFTCDLAPTEPAALLAAIRDRLASREPDSLSRANRAAVLVDGHATELDAIELLDAFLAERRRWLRAHGVADADARIEAEVVRHLGP